MSKKQYEQMQDRLAELMRQLKEIENRPFLISVERKGKKNQFVFVRKNEVIQVETLSTIADDIKGWKDKLLR